MSTTEGMFSALGGAEGLRGAVVWSMRMRARVCMVTGGTVKAWEGVRRENGTRDSRRQGRTGTGGTGQREAVQEDRTAGQEEHRDRERGD